jgi:NAD(P)-dependent dehydrogenase (short-subunit alcohol dehydrogenase family)
MGARCIEAGHRAKPELAAKGFHVQPIQLDVTDLSSLSSAVEFIRNECHRLDILVNNAGILIDGQAGLLTLDEAVLYQTMETNFLGAFRLCHQNGSKPGWEVILRSDRLKKERIRRCGWPHFRTEDPAAFFTAVVSFPGEAEAENYLHIAHIFCNC